MAALVDVKGVAEELLGSLDRCEPAVVLAELGDRLTVDVGYGIQKELRALRLAGGWRHVGYKVGCTSPTVRSALGIDEAVRGDLWQEQQEVGGVGVGMDDYGGLAIEGELAVELVCCDGPVEEWLCVYAPVIELHHGRFDCDASVRAGEVVAKNGLHAGVVCGVQWSEVCKVGEIPTEAPINVYIGGEHRESMCLKELELDGVAGALGTITWLKKTLEAEGEPLRHGFRILTATPGSLIPVSASDEHIRVTFNERLVQCSLNEGSGRAKGTKGRSMNAELS